MGCDPSVDVAFRGPVPQLRAVHPPCAGRASVMHLILGNLYSLASAATLTACLALAGVCGPSSAPEQDSCADATDDDDDDADVPSYDHQSDLDFSNAVPSWWYRNIVRVLSDERDSVISQDSLTRSTDLVFYDDYIAKNVDDDDASGSRRRC